MNTKNKSMLDKHIKQRLKSIKKSRKSRVMIVSYVRTKNNLVDPFTKRLSQNVIFVIAKDMGVGISSCHHSVAQHT
jgi:hypothetical protein